MADTPDPLNALQDIRLPSIQASSLMEQMAMPLFAGVTVAAIILILLAFRSRQKAESLEKIFIAAVKASERLPDDERLAAQASAMRRHVNLVRGDAAAHKQGEDWLAELDEVFTTEFFSKGAGRVLLDGIYSKQEAFKTAGLGAVLCELMSRKP